MIYPTWCEAEVIADPVKPQQLKEPRLLVKRRKSPLVSYDANIHVEVCHGTPAISLFTGAGGIDLGLENAGYETRCQVELAEHACQTLLANRPNCFRSSALIQADIRELPTVTILSASDLRVGETRLIAGGPPCQGFSTCNMKSRNNRVDARNDLVYEFLRVVREAQPWFFMMENVRGFTLFNKGDYAREYLRTAFLSGYELVYGLVNCVEYGVPQDRCRFVCMGSRRDVALIDGMLAGLPEPECFGKKDVKILKTWPDDLAQSAELSEQRRRLRRAPGIRYFPDREVLFPPDPWGADGRTKSFHDFYDRLERDEPDRLVRTRKEAA